jgi:hypothetical protein
MVKFDYAMALRPGRGSLQLQAMAPTLLVLAAGLGSRYGGLKQIDPVGPSGETLLDYAVFDAIRAGFGRVVFIIRQDFAEVFREKIGARYAGHIAVDYVFQDVSNLPPGAPPPSGREKPWGTGHAVWCAQPAIHAPFAVINADDFYGAEAFEKLAKFLGQLLEAGEKVSTLDEFAMVGFKLNRTLSEHGTVSRGICETGPAGQLTAITEQTGIARAEVGAGKKYSGEELVSMNCWGFTPALFVGLEVQLWDFLAAHGSDPKAEFYLPAAVSTMIARGEAAVRVLSSDSAWFGVTHREDKPRVQAALAELVSAGKYPAKLF